MGLDHTPGRTPEEIKLLKCLLMGFHPMPRTRRVAAPAGRCAAGAAESVFYPLAVKGYS